MPNSMIKVIKITLILIFILLLGNNMYCANARKSDTVKINCNDTILCLPIPYSSLFRGSNYEQYQDVYVNNEVYNFGDMESSMCDTQSINMLYFTGIDSSTITKTLNSLILSNDTIICNFSFQTIQELVDYLNNNYLVGTWSSQFDSTYEIYNIVLSNTNLSTIISELNITQTNEEIFAVTGLILNPIKIYTPIGCKVIKFITRVDSNNLEALQAAAISARTIVYQCPSCIDTLRQCAYVDTFNCKTLTFVTDSSRFCVPLILPSDSAKFKNNGFHFCMSYDTNFVKPTGIYINPFDSTDFTVVIDSIVHGTVCITILNVQHITFTSNHEIDLGCIQFVLDNELFTYNSTATKKFDYLSFNIIDGCNNNLQTINAWLTSDNKYWQTEEGKYWKF